MKALPILAALFLLIVSLSMLLSPTKEFSESENRALTQWKAPTLSSVANGSYFAHLRDACADQFPLRNAFCALKAHTERLLGKRENNDVLFGKDGYLIAKCEYDTLRVATQNLDAIDAFQKRSALPVTTLLVPRSVDLLDEQLPAFFEPSDDIYDVIRQSKLADPSLLSEVLQSNAHARQIFYRTDHHWTTEGAYLAYTALAPLLGVTPYREDFFAPATVSKSFRGTSDSKIGGVSKQADTITLYRYKDDDSFLVIDEQTGESRMGFYSLDALREKDQYRVFLGGNTALLSVRSTLTQSRPHLLLIKDSFANSLVPFLALHFNLTLVDPRYDTTPLSELISTHDFDQILILHGIDTLATDPSLARKLNR